MFKMTDVFIHFYQMNLIISRQNLVMSTKCDLSYGYSWIYWICTEVNLQIFFLFALSMCIHFSYYLFYKHFVDFPINADYKNDNEIVNVITNTAGLMTICCVSARSCIGK